VRRKILQTPKDGPFPNPYDPPRTDVGRAAPPTHAPGKGIAALYGAALVANAIVSVADYTPALRYLSGPARTALAPVVPVLAMAWLYAAWKGLPPPYRGTVSPGRAALSLLIPVYNAYWAIAVNLALCETLDGILRRVGDDRRAPRALGLIACATWLGSVVVGIALAAAHHPLRPWFSFVTPYVTHGMWLAYMIACDRARDAVARLGDRIATLGHPRLSELQRQRPPRAFMVICILGFLLFLVVWQILQPGPVRSHAM
jgi:hypothetical protein